MTIHKFPLPDGAPHAFDLVMPLGSLPLSVAVQDEKMVLWAMVNPRSPMGTRRFVTCFTGGEVPPECTLRGYVGTCQLSGLVYHVFQAVDLPR